MDTLRKHKKTLGIIGVIIVAFVLYNFFLKPDGTQEGVVSNTPSEQPQAGREILSLLIDLKEIQLNGELLRSQTFQSFEDFSVPIAPEPKGRPNPFAPVGVDQSFETQEGDEASEGTEGTGGTGVPPENEPADF